MSGARPDTWMPLYIGDYLADTMHLTRDQHGAYLLLIFAYWRRGGPLPDNDAQLAAIAKATFTEWRRGLRGLMASFFQIADGAWRHKRVDEELAEAERLSNRGRAGGRASSEQRANKTPTKLQQDANETPTKAEPNPNPLPSPSPSPSKKDSEAYASAAVAASTPLDLKREVWRIGKLFLGKQGIDEKRAGTLLGGWRRDHGDGAVLAALAAAEAECATEPIEFIVACLQRFEGKRKSNRVNGHGPATKLFEGAARALAELDEQEADRRASVDAAKPLLGRG